jgi:hypothetical protein
MLDWYHHKYKIKTKETKDTLRTEWSPRAW